MHSLDLLFSRRCKEKKETERKKDRKKETERKNKCLKIYRKNVLNFGISKD